MSTETKDRWYTFMLAIIIVALGAIGGLMMSLNTQTWNKLDRISTLFIHERDLMNNKLDKINDKVNCVELEHQKDMKGIEQKLNGGKK